jgi:hypothetical protein
MPFSFVLAFNGLFVARALIFSTSSCTTTFFPGVVVAALADFFAIAVNDAFSASALNFTVPRVVRRVVVNVIASSSPSLHVPAASSSDALASFRRVRAFARFVVPNFRLRRVVSGESRIPSPSSSPSPNARPRVVCTASVVIRIDAHGSSLAAPFR